MSKGVIDVIPRMSHIHEYEVDTRDWAKQPGGAGYLCRICGFRIPESSITVAVQQGAKLIDASFLAQSCPKASNRHSERFKAAMRVHANTPMPISDYDVKNSA